MVNDVFEFRWSLPEQGYQWRQVAVLEQNDDPTPREPEWVLTDGLAIGDRYQKKRYAPLRMFGGLFRTFGQTPPTREGILAFANQYGNLGITALLNVTAPEEPNRLLGMWGEPEAAWIKEIDSMRRAVEMWDLARTNDGPGLHRFLQWKKAGVGDYWVYDSHPHLPSIKEDWRLAIPPPPGRSQEMLNPVGYELQPDDVVTAALFLIQRWINKHLEDTVAPRLVYHLDLGKPVLRFMPKDLLGALWLQLAQAIDANKEYRACKECGKWYEVSLDGDGRTKRRLFCSEPCKSKDYRQRRERARELQAAGRPAGEISKELATAMATIKKWLRRPRK